MKGASFRPTHLYTLRHGETTYSAERRYAGTIDVPLSAKGRQTVRQLRSSLSSLSYDVVVTSPLKRAMQTARCLRRPGVPVISTPLCRERKFGQIEGLTWDQVLHLEPPLMMIRVGEDLHTVNPKGAEPFEEVWARAQEFRSFLLSNFSRRHVLIVSHGVFLQMFHGLLRGLTCIESLATYPGDLELRKFTVKGCKLAKEVLVHPEQPMPVRW